MANVKISGLPKAVTRVGAFLLGIQGGVNKQFPAELFAGDGTGDGGQVDVLINQAVAPVAQEVQAHSTAIASIQAALATITAALANGGGIGGGGFTSAPVNTVRPSIS